MSTGLIFLVAYVAGAMLTFVPLTRLLVKWYTDGVVDPDTADLAFNAVVALFLVPFWPLGLPVWWAVRLIQADKPKTPDRAADSTPNFDKDVA